MSSEEKLFEFAEYIIHKQNSTLQENDNFHVALDIRSDDQFFILNVFEKVLLNNEKYFEQINWSKWKIYFVSEMLIPLDSSNSHYHQFKTKILDRMIHKYGHLNLGPTVITINENLLDPSDKKHVEENHLINEYTDLLPESFDLMVLSPYIELDISSDRVVVATTQKHCDGMFLNLPVFKKAKNICFIINDAEDASLFEPESNYKLITNKLPSKVITFLISKIHDS